MERSERRASILKRKSLNQSIHNESIPDVPSMNKDAKRVSFHSSNFIKPFASDPEKNTIWDTTYEETVNNTDSTKSSENSAARMSQISGASAFHICELEDLPAAKVEEHDKENYVPIARMSSNTSEIEIDLCIHGDTTISSLIAQETVSDEVKQLKCLPLEENTTLDFTCTYVNRQIQENTAKNKSIDLPVLELSVITGSENIPSGIKDNLETTSMEFTSVLSTDILTSDRFIEKDQDLKVSNQDHNEERLLNFSSTDEYTKIHNVTSAMDFTCATGSENIPSGIKDNFETTSMEFTSVLSNDILTSDRFIEKDQDLKVSNQEHNEKRLLNFSSTDEYTNVHNVTSAMDFTCATSIKQVITSSLDFTSAPSNKKDISSAMDITCASNNTENVSSAMNFTSAASNKQCNTSKTELSNLDRKDKTKMGIFKDSKLEIDITLPYGHNKDLTEPASNLKNDSLDDYTGVQNIPSSSDFTSAPTDKKDITSVMDITCASNNTENVSSAMNFTSAASNKQCNTSKAELMNLDRKVETKMGIFKDSKLEIDITVPYEHNKELTEPASDSKNDSLDYTGVKNITSSLNLTCAPSNKKDITCASDNTENVSSAMNFTSAASNKQCNTSKTEHTVKKRVNSTDVNDVAQISNDFCLKRDTELISTTNIKELTFSKTPNKLEQTYTVKKGVNSTDVNDVAQTENDFCLKRDTELILTTNIPKDLQTVNTSCISIVTSFSNSLGIDQPGRASYARNSKEGQCLNQQEPAEVSSSSNKELAPANPTYEHCGTSYLTDIVESNTCCNIFDTTAPLPDDLPDDISTVNCAMTNKLALLQDSVYKDKIEIVENSTDTRDQKSLDSSKLDDIKVANTTDLLLKRRGSRIVQEIINGPQTLFDNTPVNKHLITRLEETHKKVQYLLKNFKMPEIVIDLAELEKMENEYDESSNSRLSDGLLGTTSGDNNSAEDADFEIPSLDERLQEQAKRSIKYWQFVKCINNDCYCFYTFSKCCPFKVYIDPSSGIVREIETFSNLIDNALPSYIYEIRYIHEKLKKDNLLLALGSAYDILTLLDYVVMIMEEVKAFDKEYDKLEEDFGKAHHLTMNQDYSLAINVRRVEFLLWWEITMDLSIHHLGCITSVKARHHESTDEPVNEEIIQKIAMNTEGPLFIRNFIIGINNYVNREGPKRLAQRKENLKKKYNFLTFK